MTEKEIKDIEEKSIGYYKTVYAAGYKKLQPDVDRTEDCAQETYLDLENALKVRGCNIFYWKKWINAAVAINIKKALSKKIGFNKHNVSIEFLQETLFVSFQSPSACVESQIEFLEEKRKLYHYMEQLCVEDAQLVIKHYFCREKIRDIARNIGVSEAVLKKRHERVKKKLMKMLREDVKYKGGQH